MHRICRGAAWGFVVASSFAAVPGLSLQTPVEPGFNLFSLEQDVEVGRRSAAEVEQQLRMLLSRPVESYVRQMGERLVGSTPGPDFPYQFKVVNAAEINAFALPGGFIYINRGLIAAADSEGELAGVMAHEISHAALRHGTNQVSKAYLAQTGLGVLGGLFGGGSTAQIINAAGGFGFNALFLKFSRNAEKQADILGTQILAGARYDPIEMATFFDELRERAGRDPGGVEQFFSSHPSPGDRAERVRAEVDLLGQVRPGRPVGDFSRLQAALVRLPDPPPPRPREDVARDRPERRTGRYRGYTDQTGSIWFAYPESWRVSERPGVFGVTVTPPNGVVRSTGGRQDIVWGFLIGTYTSEEVRQGRGRSPETAFWQSTEELAELLSRANPYLTIERDSWRMVRFAAARGLSVRLSGVSGVTRLEERVTLLSRPLRREGQLLYALLIAPSRDYPALAETFETMLQSLRIRHQPR